ncbi:helix-turn-helix domain-containing protein [Listeria monocytogenes]|uniref:helix-turn-helix domain-containing protein n=1 Tax=Listeria monocytogenes TaxID=1639 RepID=UPI00190E0D2F|nr:helix-turn-helix domain-containing protein [Listeria monocytogenes]MBK3674038.1 helix-turn-helix domain-containing protein [Listeria monocytogenes]MBV0970168.1 helix-turn-helix domain-containing protein [Listeria monocytogenes]
MFTNELMSFFLTQNQIKKLGILIKIRDGKSVTLNSGNKSKRQTRELINSLLKEVNDFFQQNSYHTRLEKNDSIFLFSPTIEDDLFVELLNNIREGYITNSSFFQALTYSLENREFSLNEMALELSYSESYVYKLLTKLQTFFNLLKIDVEVQKFESTVKLIGDESYIRMLNYFSVLLVFRENTWPFKNITEKKIITLQKYLNSNKYDRLSPNNKKRTSYVLAIYELALGKGARVNVLEQEIIDLGLFMNKEKNISLYLNHLKEEYLGSREQFNQEIAHLYFFATYFIPELLSNNEKEELGKNVYSLKENSVVRSATLLIDCIKKKFDIPEDIYFQLIFCICSRFIVIHYLGLYKFMKPEKNEVSSETEKFIEESIDICFKQIQSSDSFSMLKFNLIQVISSYIILTVNVSQKVYVEFFHRPAYKTIIENSLKINHDEKTIKIVDNYYQADIVISDVRPKDENKTYFYFKDIFDQDSWKNLSSFISHSIKEKVLYESKLTD